MVGTTCIALCVLVVIGGGQAFAQERSLIDAELGAGHSFSGEAPSLGTLTLGATWWPARGRWGVAAARIVSYGDEQFDTPTTSGNVTFLGKTNLQYWRLGGRYRREVGARATLVFGAGVAGGSHENLVRQEIAGIVRDHRGRIEWGAVSGELYWDQQFNPWFRARFGVTLDLGPDQSVLQPVAVAAVSFQ